MAKSFVGPGKRLDLIIASAGANHALACWHEVTEELECPDVSQAALDAAIAGYVAPAAMTDEEYVRQRLSRDVVWQAALEVIYDAIMNPQQRTRDEAIAQIVLKYQELKATQ